MDNSDGQESLLMVSHGNDATWYLLREFWTASWDGTGEIIFNGSSALPISRANPATVHGPRTRIQVIRMGIPQTFCFKMHIAEGKS